MSIFLIATLILFGLLLIILEILIIPGIVVGLLGAVFVVLGLAGIWTEYGSTAGWIATLLTAGLSALSIWSALRTGFWRRFSLQDKLEGKANVIEPDAVHAGDRGHAVSSLRPMGTVRVNGQRFEGASESGQIIPPNFPIEVVRIDGGKLIVRPVR